jgi:hypothetical protein
MIPFMRLRRLLPLLVVTLASAPSSGAQGVDSRRWPPALVADSFFRATGAERWNDAVHFLDLEAIAQLRNEQVRFARRPARITPLTVERLLELDPDMPRAVAEYQVKKSNEASTDISLLAYEFARIPSIDTLAALPVAEVAARWLEAQGLRWQLQRSLASRRGHGCELSDSLLTAALFSRPTATPIFGTVVEDSTAWVLYGYPLDTSDASPRRARRTRRVAARSVPPQVMTLRLVEGAWRIVPGFGNASVSFVSECVPVGPRKSAP